MATGSVRTEFTTYTKTQCEKTYTISVSVVVKIDKGVKDFIIGLSQHYVGEETVRIMMSVIKPRLHYPSIMRQC